MALFFRSSPLEPPCRARRFLADSAESAASRQAVGGPSGPASPVGRSQAGQLGAASVFGPCGPAVGCPHVEHVCGGEAVGRPRDWEGSTGVLEVCGRVPAPSCLRHGTCSWVGDSRAALCKGHGGAGAVRAGPGHAGYGVGRAEPARRGQLHGGVPSTSHASAVRAGACGAVGPGRRRCPPGRVCRVSGPGVLCADAPTAAGGAGWLSFSCRCPSAVPGPQTHSPVRSVLVD